MSNLANARRLWTAAFETAGNRLASIRLNGAEVFHVTVDRRVIVTGSYLDVMCAIDAIDPDHGLPLAGLTAQEMAESWVRARYLVKP